MFKAANESKSRPLAAIGSERAARLAAIGNQDLGKVMAPPDNLNPCPNSRGARLPAIGSERAARLLALRNLNTSQGLAVWQLQSSRLSLPLEHNDVDISFSVIPYWQTDPPTGGHSQNESATHQQKLDSSLQRERVPHPERNPLPPPSPPRTTRPEGFYLLLDNSPVQAERSWLSMLPKLQGKAESTPLPELPLPLNDDRVLDDLHRVQAINRRLVERIFGQMPDEQSRHRFQGELLRQQLAAEQQLMGFLGRKLGQDPGCLGLEMERMQ